MLTLQRKKSGADNADLEGSERKGNVEPKNGDNGNRKKKQNNAHEKGLGKRKHCRKHHKAPESKCWKNPNRIRNAEESDGASSKEAKRKRFDEAAIKKAKEFAHAMLEKEEVKTQDEFGRHCNAMSNKKFGHVGTDNGGNTGVCGSDCCCAFQEGIRPDKKQRTGESETDCTGEIIAELPDCDGKTAPVRVSIDSGTSKSTILRDCVRKGRAKSCKGQSHKWTTSGGVFATDHKALVDFKFPEFSKNKAATWTFHVDAKTPKDRALHDMMAGMDLLARIRPHGNAEDEKICWEGSAIPLKHCGELSTRKAPNEAHATRTAPLVLMEAEERQARALDANCKKTEMQEFAKESRHLSVEEQQALLETLRKFPTLFSGGLGTPNVRPVHLELKEGVAPTQARPFPVPQALHGATKREIQRSDNVNVPERNNDGQWAAPSFAQKKKTGDVRAPTDFQKLNEATKRKPFPLPKISELPQRLRGFRHAAAID